MYHFAAGLQFDWIGFHPTEKHWVNFMQHGFWIQTSQTGYQPQSETASVILLKYQTRQNYART